MFLCSLIEELCTKEENDKTGGNFNFGHECMSGVSFLFFPVFSTKNIPKIILIKYHIYRQSKHL